MITKTYRLLALVALLFILLASSVFADNQEQSYSVPNASFEEEPIDEGEIPGWNANIRFDELFLERSDEFASDGDYSLHFFDNNQSHSLRIESDLFKIDGGENYRLNVDVFQIYQTHRVGLELHFYDESGAQVGDFGHLFTEEELELERWTTINILGIAPEDATHASIYFHSGAISITQMYFDNVRVHSVDPDNLALTIEASDVFEGEHSTIAVKDERGDSIANAEVSILDPQLDMAIITGDSAPVYQTPSEEAEQIYTAELHEAFLVLETTEDGWSQIWLRNGYAGWISDQSLDIQPWGQPLGVTDEDGTFETPYLTLMQQVMTLQAAVGERTSDPIMIEIYGLLGTERPENIALTRQQDPRTTASFTWRTTPIVTGTVVEVLQEDQFTGSFENTETIRLDGESFLFVSDIGEMRIHEAEVTGLQPGTQYVYRVGTGEEGQWSDPYSFTTESDDEEPFTFMFLTDSQGLSEADFTVWNDVLGKAAEAYPEASFMLHGGDLVDNGDRQQEWEFWFDAAKDYLPNIFLVPVIGNHDNVGTGLENYRAQFQLPRNGPEGEVEHAYSFDYGNAHFVILNTEGNLERQVEWLREDLSQTEQEWIIVSGHRPPYPSHRTRTNDETRDAFAPVFDEFGVDLYLSGHDHNYMRTWPLVDGSRVDEGEGTTYVIGGSAGVRMNPLGNHHYMREAVFGTQMYSGITIDGNELTMEIHALDGQLIDSFTLVKEEVIHPELFVHGPEVLQQGGFYDLELKLEHLVDVYGAAMMLEYDPNQLHVEEVLPGELIEGSVIENEVNTETGTISFAVTQLGDTPGVDGSGTLATVRVEVLAEGIEEVNVSVVEERLQLLNSLNVGLDVQFADYFATIEPGDVIERSQVIGRVALPDGHDLQDRSGFIVTLVQDEERLASQETDLDGRFQLNTDGIAGTFSIVIEREGYLPTSGIITIDPASGTIDTGEMTLFAGDFNGDGIINIEDIYQLAKVYEQEPLDELILYDVNGDGLIDRTDIDIVVEHFGMQQQ